MIAKRADGSFIHFTLDEPEPSMWLATPDAIPVGVEHTDVKSRTETRVPLTPEQAERVRGWLR